MEIHPLRRATLHDEIMEQVQEAILAGDLSAGERLPTERSLAQRFGVSRTTVRQALASLEAQGLIRSAPGSGTYVSKPERGLNGVVLAQLLDGTHLRLKEALEVRAVLEPAAAEMTAERATDGEVTDIRKTLEDMAAAIECDGATSDRTADAALVKSDAAFHAAIARASGNRLFRAVIEGISATLQESRRLSMSAPGGPKRSLEDHKRIYSAIQDHRPQEARELMRAHISHVESLAEIRFEQFRAGED